MTIKGDFESISMKELKMVINELNKSGCVEDSFKVDTKKVKKKLDLIEGFLNAVESIPPDSDEEEKLPGKTVTMYNSVVELLEGEDAPEEDKVSEEDEVPDDEGVSEDDEDDEPEEKPAPKKGKAKKADTKKESSKKKDKPSTKKETSKKSDKKAVTKKADKKTDAPKKEGPPKKDTPKDELGAVIGKGTNLINEEFKEGGTFKEIADKLGTVPGRVRSHYSALVKSGVEFKTKTHNVKGIGGQEREAINWVKIKKIPENFKKA